MDFTSEKCPAGNNGAILTLCLCGAVPCTKTGKAQLECAKSRLKQKTNVLKKGN